MIHINHILGVILRCWLCSRGNVSASWFCILLLSKPLQAWCNATTYMTSLHAATLGYILWKFTWSTKAKARLYFLQCICAWMEPLCEYLHVMLSLSVNYSINLKKYTLVFQIAPHNIPHIAECISVWILYYTNRMFDLTPHAESFVITAVIWTCTFRYIFRIAVVCIHKEWPLFLATA